ncbi:MAG: HAMP domain-containing histidine kinase [Bacteroidales bacterium]|nr:HAMP domain-containing histidine kinase [Bacteroidales bacterium]
MKRRILFTLASILIIASIVLIVGIVTLYWQAEKQQAMLFDRDVQKAGYNAIATIENVLNGEITSSNLNLDKDSTETKEDIYFQKCVRQYLIDTVSKKRVGFVKGVIDFESNAVIPLDTLYYDTLYQDNTIYLKAGKWVPDIDVIQYGEWHGHAGAHMRKMAIEMDSATILLLDRKFLNRVVKNALIEQSIEAEFDLAIYTSYSSEFILNPQKTAPKQMLKSAYFFRLKSSDRFVAPYYLILYFPTMRTYLLHQMGKTVGTIAAFLAIILGISAITLFSLYRQKKISDMKNEFIDNMTHELKTPIATISLACEAMQNETILENNESRKEYVGIIKEENNRLKNMVSNVLRTAQLRRGQIAMDIAKVNLHDVIEKVVESVTLQVHSKNGEVFLNLQASNPIIYADADHIRNVVVNLVENAVKYAKETPQITLSTSNDDKHLRLSVKDNGIGIAKKNIKHLFEDFYRVPTKNKHDVKGYGLGLSYVKKIVLLHNGSIKVNSELGKGTEFIISIPNKK